MRRKLRIEYQIPIFRSPRKIFSIEPIKNLWSVKAYYKTNEFFFLTDKIPNSRRQETSIYQAWNKLQTILTNFLSGQSFQCLLCRLEDRFSDSRLEYFLSSCTVLNLGKFLLVGGILKWVNAWTVYFFSRFICIPLFICMFRFCVFFSQEHQKMQPPGTLVLKLFQNSQHVFLSSLNLLALRAGISFLKHYIGWYVTSIFAQSKYSRPDLSCFKPFLPVQRCPFLPGLAWNQHKKSPSPPLRIKISVNKVVSFPYQAPETFWF